jgi:hypothetical protein
MPGVRRIIEMPFISSDDAFGVASVERSRSAQDLLIAQLSLPLPYDRRVSLADLSRPSLPSRDAPLPVSVIRRKLSNLHLLRSNANPVSTPDIQPLPTKPRALLTSLGSRTFALAAGDLPYDALNEALQPPKLKPHILTPKFNQACFAWNDKSSIETWAAVTSSPARKMPLLYLSAYAAGRWDVDIFVLPHNAIRAELMDMVDGILAGFGRAGIHLSLGHIHDFGAWWAVFEAFVLSYFNLEDAILLPWAYQTGNPNSQLAELSRYMAVRRTRVEHLINEVSNAFVLFRCKPSGEVLPLLYRALHALTPRILSYFAKQEQQVVRIVDPSRVNRADLERAVFSFFLESQHGLTNTYLLTRWAPQPAGPVQKLIKSRVRATARVRLASHARHVHATHLKIVQNFRATHLPVQIEGGFV